MKRILLTIPLLLQGCDNTPAHQKTTQWRLKDTLTGCEEYAVRLIDMKDTEDYYHKYRIKCGKSDKSPDQLLSFTDIPTDWVKVDADTYNKYLNDLDRNILTRNSQGEVSNAAQPPGYQYVGDQKYGEWKANDSGQKEWVFIPMFLPSFPSPPIYQNDYDDYRSYRRDGKSYYRSDYEDRVKRKYTNRKPNFYEELEKRKYERQRSYESYKAKSAVNRAAGNYGTTNPRGPPKTYNTPTPTTKPPLTFQEKLTKTRAAGSTSNISGYSKTSKKFQTKKVIKKKPSFKERIKAKVKKITKKVRRAKKKK